MNSIRKERDKFIENLDGVVEFIVFNSEQGGVLEKLCSNKVNIQAIDLENVKKKFMKIMSMPVTYNATIISIYGCYEAYIDKISSSLLDFWKEKASCYSEISESIRNKHIQKCGEFLSNPQRYQNMDITQMSVISNLNMCLTDEKMYMLNKELLLTHSGNLGIGQLIHFFKELGLKDSRIQILNNSKYIEYISKKYELSTEDARKLINNRKNDDKFLFEELTQLVEQRNKVAHGWSVDERLSSGYLSENIIPFMKMLGCVIADIFISEFVEILHMTNSLKKFDDAIAVYNKRTLCINCKDSNLKCNGYIYANTGKRYIALNIKELQYNRQTIKEISDDNKDIGILVDSDVKKEWEFYYL